MFDHVNLYWFYQEVATCFTPENLNVVADWLVILCLCQPESLDFTLKPSVHEHDQSKKSFFFC